VKSVIIGYGALGIFTAVSWHVHPHGVPYWYVIGVIVILVVAGLCFDRELRERR